MSNHFHANVECIWSDVKHFAKNAPDRVVFENVVVYCSWLGLYEDGKGQWERKDQRMSSVVVVAVPAAEQET